MTQPDDEVPRLPRGRGIKLDGPMMLRIGFTLALLIMVVISMKPCANAASKFVMGFEGSGSGSATVPAPGTVDVVAPQGGSAYEPIRTDMSDEEIRAAIERAKQRAKEGSGSGSGSGSAAEAPAPGPGAATPPTTP